MTEISNQLCRFAFSAALLATLFACGGNVQQNPSTPTLKSAPPAAPADITATFTGPRNNYRIVRTTTGFTVKDLVGNGGDVTLTNHTIAKFSNMFISLTAGDQSKTISASDLKTLTELYIAFFNRVPDGNGMIYWIGQIRSGRKIEDLANNFYDAAIIFSDVTGYKADMSNADFVKIIYKNVLGRDEVDAEGMAYWTDALVKPAGTVGAETRGTLIRTIINSAHTFKGHETLGWVADLLDNKVSVGLYFSIQHGINYNTDNESISEGVKIASLITPTDINAAKAKIGVTDALFDLTAAVSTSEFDQVQTIINARCVSCHSAQRAEQGIALHTAALIRQNAGAVYIAAVVNRTMPQGGSLSDADITTIKNWFESGAK